MLNSSNREYLLQGTLTENDQRTEVSKVSSEEKQRRELQKLLQAPGLKQQKGGEAITRIQNTLTAKMLGAAATPETPPSPPEPSKAAGSSSHR